MSRLSWRWVGIGGIGAGLCLLGCAAGDSGNGFNSFGGSFPNTSTTQNGSGDGSGGGSGGSGGGGGSSSTTTTAGGTTSDGSTGGMTTMGSTGTTDPTAASMTMTTMTTAMMTTGGQPQMGMYAHCLDDPNVCNGGTNTCLQVIDAMMVVIDGFCTIDTCAGGGANCDASPGGTVTPTCVPLDDGMGGQVNLCALNCAGGLVCPTGMICYDLGVAQICA